MRQCLLALRLISISSLLTALASSFAWGRPVEPKAQALAHYIMAVSHDLNGEAGEAVAEYEKSIKCNGTEPAPRLRLGAYYLRLEKIDAAIQQLKAVTRIAPRETHAHYLLALVYSSQHKYELAAEEYETVLKNEAHEAPANPEVYMYLGQLYYAQGKYSQAVEEFLRILQLDHANTSALNLLGSVYADTNQPQKAIDAFRRALQIDPDNSEALNSLGYTYAQQGIHLDEADTMVRRAVKIDPANGAYYDSLGWVLYKKGMLTESLLALQKAQTFIEDAILYDHLGDVFKALKEYPLACRYWRKSLDLEPHQPLVETKIKTLRKCTASLSSHRQR